MTDNTEKFRVTNRAQRPAKMDGCCFHCRQRVGTTHEADCVLIKKKAIVRAVIEYEVNVPHFWSKEDIEFHRNESSWCSSNLLNELRIYIDKEERCLCSITKFQCLETNDKPFLDE